MTSNAVRKAKILKYKSIGRQLYETVILLFAATFLLLTVSLGVMLHRSLLMQGELTRYVGIIEKYNGDVEAAKTTSALMSLVERRISLPKNEYPYVAEIKDVSKLFSMKAFESALNGDKCLIYPENKLIVIYRPSDDAIVAHEQFEPENLTTLSQNSSPTHIPENDSEPRVLMSTDEAKLASSSGRMSQ